MTEFELDWASWYKELPIGKYAHWCNDWDGLPIDSSFEEFQSCNCTMVDSDGNVLRKGPGVFQVIPFDAK